MLLEQVHTSGEQTESTLNQYRVNFQSVLVDTAPTPIRDNSKYVITAGVEYADEEYIWIGQAEISTALAGEVS